MAEENIDIFEDFDNSQEYFDYLKESSEPDPDRIAKEKAVYEDVGEAAVGFAKGAYDAPKNVASYAALPLSLFGQGAPVDEMIPELTDILPFLSRFENDDPEEQFKLLNDLTGLETTGPEATGAVVGAVTGGIGSFEALTRIKEKYPDTYKKLSVRK